MLRASAALLVLCVAACSTPSGPWPSLAPRASEEIDPRAPVGGPVVAGAVDPALASSLTELVGQARAGDAQFQQAAAEAERLAAAAGAPQSESWVAAQQAVSAAQAARAPTTRAMGDIDALAATALAARGWLPPADLSAVEAAAAEVAAMDRRQAERIDALQARLGG